MIIEWLHIAFVVAVELLTCVQLFATPWTATYQASLSFTASLSFLKLMSIESVMPSKYAIKAGLKLNIQKTKIIASSPIASWQIDGETMETVRDFIFLGSKIPADGDCSHEI